MSDRYIIQWKSLENGRFGRGTKTFSRQEAELLAEDLNRQFPQIRHEAAALRGGGGHGHRELSRPGGEPSTATKETGSALSWR